MGRKKKRKVTTTGKSSTRKGGRHTRGFEEGVSIDNPPTDLICVECLGHGFADDGRGGCHPRTVMRQIRQTTPAMIDAKVKAGLMSPGDMAQCGNGHEIEPTCFTFCKALTDKQRKDFVRSATFQNMMKERPPSESAIRQTYNPTTEQKVLQMVWDKKALAHASDIIND